MNATRTAAKAKVFAVAMEIFCPVCKREDPIPATDGSFMWDRKPDTVTCPDCGTESYTETKIRS